ncbi:MAG: hypothetical protein ACT4O2_09360 [Beijerinckiaceae bacterium]
MIDTATNKVVGTPIPVGDGPFGVAVTPDGTKVYVTNFLSNTVSVIATATNTLVATIPIPVGNCPTAFGNFIGGKAFLSSFPLKDLITGEFLTPYTVPIISVFDHSMESSLKPGVVHLYGCDLKVFAFTGDKGLQENGADGTDCTHQPGYKNKSGTPFSLTGVNYTGTLTNGPNYLEYDGHPGYDYRPDTYSPFTLNKDRPVFAATSGTIFYPLEAVGMVKSGHPNRAYCFFHALAQIPDGASNYRVYYLHLLTHPASTLPGATPQCQVSNGDTQGQQKPFTPQPKCVYTDSSGKPFVPTTFPLPAGTHVMSGCKIARTGDAGVPGSPHLHFEVQQIFPKSLVAVAAQAPRLNCFNEITYNRDPSLICLPMDPYGWAGPTTNCNASPPGGDKYACLTGVTSTRLWLASPPK